MNESEVGGGLALIQTSLRSSFALEEVCSKNKVTWSSLTVLTMITDSEGLETKFHFLKKPPFELACCMNISPKFDPQGNICIMSIFLSNTGRKISFDLNLRMC